MKQRLRTLMPAATLVLTVCWAVTQLYAEDKPKVVDRHNTKKLIKLAEERMGQYRLSHPLDKKRIEGEFVPNLIEDQESPLTGQTCTMKFKYKDQIKGVDPQSSDQETDSDQAAQKDQETFEVIVGEFKTDLKEYYDYNKLYDDHREIKKVYDKMIKNLRHEILIALPSGHELPKKMPKKAKAIVKVTAVEWDHGAVLPTLVIHSELVESKDLTR